MYYYLGSHRLAEKTLRDAAKINPYAPETWYVNLNKFTKLLKNFCYLHKSCTGIIWEKYWRV